MFSIQNLKSCFKFLFQVVGVVGQAELLSALFALLSFMVFHYGCVNERSLLLNISYSFASCVLSIVAMLCKEQGITIIVSDHSIEYWPLLPSLR